MDPLTHTLTGLALSRAGLRRLSPYATPIVLLAANGPDIDILAAPWGAVTYLHYHRHITHALISIPVLAALAVLVVRPFARKKPLGWKRAYLAALLAAGSHPLLDLWNAYGIRLLLPFSSEWLRLDLVSLPDVWIWLALVTAWLAPALARLVSAEIGARPGPGRGWAIFALLFVSVYVSGRWVLHQRAVAILDSHLYNGVTAVRVAALPGPLNPFAWRGVVDAGDFYAVYDINLLGEFDPAVRDPIYKTVPGEREVAAMRAARHSEAFRVFLSFSSYPVWAFEPAEDGENETRVQVSDLRFPGGFTATAIVDAAGRVRRAAFRFR